MDRSARQPNPIHAIRLKVDPRQVRPTHLGERAARRCCTCRRSVMGHASERHPRCIQRSEDPGRVFWSDEVRRSRSTNPEKPVRPYPTAPGWCEQPGIPHSGAGRRACVGEKLRR
jgi:hypothetical protein